MPPSRMARRRENESECQATEIRAQSSRLSGTRRRTFFLRSGLEKLHAE